MMNRRQLFAFAPVPFVFASGLMNNDGVPFMLRDRGNGTEAEGLFYIYGRFGAKIDRYGFEVPDAKPLSWEDIEKQFDRDVAQCKQDLKRYIESYTYAKYKAQCAKEQGK